MRPGLDQIKSIQNTCGGRRKSEILIIADEKTLDEKKNLGLFYYKETNSRLKQIK